MIASLIAEVNLMWLVELKDDFHENCMVQYFDEDVSYLEILCFDPAEGALIIGGKVGRLKKRYENNASKSKMGEDRTFPKAHQQKGYELSKKIWFGGANAVGVDSAKVNEKTRKNQSSRAITASPKVDSGKEETKIQVEPIRPIGHLKMGIYLSTPKTEKFSEDGENGRIRYGLSSMQGWRATMEDAHAAYPDLDASTSFFGVYDGHGGKVVAKFCAKYLHQQVLKHEAYSAGDIGTSVHKAFFRMDEMMRGQRGWRELAVLGDKINKFTGMIEGLIWSPRSGEGHDQVDDWAFEEGPHSDFSGPTSGCTACVAVIKDNQLVVANAGDSRCVISRKGQAYNLSRDHKPDLEAERERILKAGGFIHAGRVNGSLNLARAIGDMEFKQNKFLPAEKQIVTANPDINTVELCDDDEFIVLACDGIWDCMSSQQLVDFLREQLNTESKLSVVCERVLDRCLAPSTAGGEGCDNMTMILVQFKKPHESAAAADADEKSSTSDHGNQSATAAADEKSSTSNQADTELKPAETESSP
ncbi:unnamed protein product [Camellia sinensis]